MIPVYHWNLLEEPMVTESIKDMAGWEIDPMEEANVHILTHSLHYGFGCLRRNPMLSLARMEIGSLQIKGTCGPTLRFCQIGNIKIPYTKREISEACKETLRVNQLKEGYIRPLVSLGKG